MIGVVHRFKNSVIKKIRDNLSNLFKWLEHDLTRQHGRYSSENYFDDNKPQMQTPRGSSSHIIYSMMLKPVFFEQQDKDKDGIRNKHLTGFPKIDEAP